MANEKRLIDANAVMHKINAFAASVVYRGSDLMFTGKDSCNPHEYTRGYEQGVLDAQKILGGQPTVDAVEVTRCGACRDWMEIEETGGAGYCNHPCWRIADIEPPIVQFADFCSYGERKTDGICKES